MQPPVNDIIVTIKCPVTGQIASGGQQSPVLGVMVDNGKHDMPSTVKSYEPTITSLIVYAHPTRTNNGKGGLDEITMYESRSMSEIQIDKLKQTIENSVQHKPTAILLTADTDQLVEQHENNSQMIETHDWRVFSSSPANVKAAEVYAQLLSELGNDKNPPLIVVFNGRVSSMTMNWFSVATTRICTENILASPSRSLSDKSLTYWPVSGLYTLTHLNGFADIGLYLQFNPQVSLRAPDCLSIGLIDRFVPDKFLGDWLRQLRSTLPVDKEMDTTTTARQLKEMTQSGDKQWPGCSVIDCWESEIQQCFAASIVYDLRVY
jgi:hypothetical protein